MIRTPSPFRALRALFVGTAAFAMAMGGMGCLDFHEGPLPGEPKRSPYGQDLYRKIDGVRVHYIDEGNGNGPPVVLIHGFASSLGTFRGVIAELEKTHRVIALDLKGFGWTDRPPGDYSPKAQAKLVLGLLKALKVDQASVVAHSWGSSIALQMVLDEPQRFDKIALYDAWVYEAQIPTFFHWARLDGLGETLFSMFYDERPDEKMATAFYDKSYVTEEMVDGVEEQLRRPGSTAAALAAVRGQHFGEVEKQYGKIKQPVLLLWGREDKITTLEYGERLSKDLQKAKLVVYPQCGHFPMYEAKNASTRELVDFLTPTQPAVTAPAQPPEPAAPTKPSSKPAVETSP